MSKKTEPKTECREVNGVKIERVPLPEADIRGRRSKFPWKELQPGESFFVPGRSRSSLSGSISYFQMKLSVKFIGHSENGGVRVFRVE